MNANLLAPKRWFFWLILVLFGLVVWLQFLFWNGNWGMNELKKLEMRVLQQRMQNEQLMQRNNALQAEVEDLKTGKDAIEERARRELGMIHLNETFYQVIQANDLQSPTTPNQPE